MSVDHEEEAAQRAWGDWDAARQAIDAAAGVVLSDPRLSSDLVRAEGVQYLARFLGSAAALEMEPNPAYPDLARFLTPTHNWGLPCPDALYHYAVLDGRFEYRLTGVRGSAHLFAVEVWEGGFYDLPSAKVFDSCTDVQFGSDGTLDMVLGHDASGLPEGAGNRLGIPEGPSMILLRQFFYDWDTECPGSFRIERVGETFPPPPPTFEDIATRQERYVRFIRDTSAAMVAAVGNHYTAPADRLPFPQLMDMLAEEDAYSLRGQVYGQGRYECDPDEAVILEVRPPECAYWSFSLYSQYWEMADWLVRQTSINGHQAVLDSDGMFRAVISHRDPSVPNWLDAGGRTFGLLGGRYCGSRTVPEPSLTRVPLAVLRGVLPADTPVVTPTERQRILQRRSRAIRQRFHP